MIEFKFTDMYEIKGNTYIHICELPCFEGRFTYDRYEQDAPDIALKFGKSLIGQKIKTDNGIFIVEKCEVGMGSFSFVSSITFKVNYEELICQVR